VDASEVEEVEPGRRDARDEESGDVGAVQVGDELTDRVRRVVIGLRLIAGGASLLAVVADGTVGEREAVDDPVGADDRASTAARRPAVRKSNAERAAPGFNRP
jgi:hypothetical protein